MHARALALTRIALVMTAHLSDVTVNVPAKRLHCIACLRPQSTCLCRWVTPTPHRVEVLILQHPMEVVQAKGSARLLHMSLPGSLLLIGEVFGATLDAALQGPRRNLLLYPQSPVNLAAGSQAPLVDMPWLLRPDRLRLVVLDGTWRKSRKMLSLNPQLQHMRRLSLTTVPASRYLIRKAHESHQLSTLEATCAALAQLEGECLAIQPLLEAFDGFVGQQITRRLLSSDSPGCSSTLSRPTKRVL